MASTSTHPFPLSRPLGLLGLAAAFAWLAACAAAPPQPATVAAPDEPGPVAAPSAAAPAGETPAAAADRAALERADGAIGELATTLSSRLVAAMKEGGAKAAVEVCAVEAQDLTRSVGDAKGIGLGRASTHLRNPSNAGPDWVKSWLDNQGATKGEGKGAVVSALREVVDTDAGRVARVIKPITMGAKCLTCHGTELAPAIAALLDERYPSDDARGYSAGDLRGAFWAEVPVER